MGLFSNMPSVSLRALTGGGAGQAFEAARRDGDPGGGSWSPSLSDGTAEATVARDKIVAKARDLDRNNGFVSGAIDRRTESVMGARIRLEATPNYTVMNRTVEWAEDWAERVEAHWDVWANNHRNTADAERNFAFGTLARLAYMEYVRDGDAVAIVEDNDTGAMFETQVRLIDSDRLSNPHGLSDGHKFANGNELFGGVEVDPDGVAVAYYIRRKHPGSQSQSSDKFKWERLTREGGTGRPQVVHAFSARRAGQKRGVSQLTQVLITNKMLDRVDKATAEAQLFQTLITAWIESEAKTSEVRDMMAPLEEDDGSDQSAYAASLFNYRKNNKVKMHPGVRVIHGFPNEKLEFKSPTLQHDNYQTFQNIALRKIASAFGLSFPQLAQNWESINYSSARTLLNEIWRSFLMDRVEFTHAFCTPIYAAWLEEAVAIGRIKVPGGPKRFYTHREALCICEWMGPGRGTIDPLKEEKAASEAIAAARMSDQQRAAEQGQDIRKIYRQLSRERKLREKLGIPEPVRGTSTANSPNAEDEDSDLADTNDRREMEGEEV